MGGVRGTADHRRDRLHVSKHVVNTGRDSRPFLLHESKPEGQQRRKEKGKEERKRRKERGKPANQPPKLINQPDLSRNPR